MAAGDQQASRLSLRGIIWNLADTNTIGWGMAYISGKTIQFAHWSGRKDIIQILFVIGAAIDVRQCLDLTKVEYLGLLEKAYQVLKSAARLLNYQTTKKDLTAIRIW